MNDPSCAFYAASKIRTLAGGIGVSDSTLRSWANNDLIRCIRMPGGKRLYALQDVVARFQGLPRTTDASTSTTPAIPETIATRQPYIYARVSSNKQKEAGDLQRQIQILQTLYPKHIVIQDTASGLNYHRRGLRTLLERCMQGMVSQVVVSDRDRLARFGVELLEWLFQKCNVSLVVHANANTEASTSTDVDDSKELADDLLAVCNFFVARNNGRRASRNRRTRSTLAIATSTHGGDQDQQSTTTDSEEMDCSSSVHIQSLCGGATKAPLRTQPEGSAGEACQQ